MFEDFEKHIDMDCSEKNTQTEYMGTQIIRPDGKIEFRQLDSKSKTYDDFLQRKKSDKDFTEPSAKWSSH